MLPNPWKILWPVVFLLIALSIVVLSGCKERTTSSEGEIPAPTRTYVPEAMVQQCVEQPDIPYCASVCEAKHVIKPRWC